MSFSAFTGVVVDGTNEKKQSSPSLIRHLATKYQEANTHFPNEILHPQVKYYTINFQCS